MRYRQTILTLGLMTFIGIGIVAISSIRRDKAWFAAKNYHG